MIYTLLLLLFSYFLAVAYQKKATFIGDVSLKRCGFVPNDGLASFLFFVLILLLTLYSGLRTTYNDTRTYIAVYLYDTVADFGSLKGLDFSFLGEPGFTIYQVLVKIIFGNNYSRFLTITSLITCASNVIFFRKYSSNFSLAIFIYITSTYYSFALAAMRQCIAIAIGIWAIPLIQKKKWIKAIVVMMIAVSFHKLVIVFAVAVLFANNVWEGKTIPLIVGVSILSFGFVRILPVFASTIGYNEENINYLVGTRGTSIFRVLVWLVPLVLSIVYKKSINDFCNPLQITIINLSIVGSLIMFLASFGAANLVARLAFYFYPFFVLSFTEMIKPEIAGKDCKTVEYLCLFGFFLYYLVLNWNPSKFFVDMFARNSIKVLFQSVV